MKKIFFDDSLSAFVLLVVRTWGAIAVKDNIFLRDVSGKLTFVVREGDWPLEKRSDLANLAVNSMGNYVDSDGFAVSTPDELFDPRLRELTSARSINVNIEEFSGCVNLVDRRMVGADWLRAPAATAKPPQRLVFASIKGGVGRSTALCVTADYFASRGKRILAIDMDIEAPGLGNMLLSDDTLPEFGLLDYLVEQNISELDDQFYADLIGSSWLSGGRGRVDVVPALGKRSLANPVNVLGKIARAYLPGTGGHDEGFSELGEQPSFMDNIRRLIERIADPLRYDAILIDARAGLHETTATAVVGLGAEVLFFGMDQPQTFAGYSLLLAHLSTLPVDESDDWRKRISFVQAKAPAAKGLRDRFESEITSLSDKYLWKKFPEISWEVNDSLDVSQFKDTFETDWVDVAPDIVDEVGAVEGNAVVAVLDSDRFHSFDPLQDRDALTEEIYHLTFNGLLLHLEKLFVPVLKGESEDAS